MTWLKKVLVGAIGAWFVATVLTFLATALVPRWPRGLELPWSGFSDFAVHPRGEVLVYLVDFDRVLTYSLDGRFLGSYPAAGYKAGRGRIATTADGRIVLEHMGRLSELDADFTLLREHESSDRRRSWVLDAEGRLTRGGVEHRDPTHPAAPGELLFGSLESPPRTEFHIAGATVLKKGSALAIRREGGPEATTLGTPWYLLPLRIPWPAFASVALLVGLVTFARWRERRAGGEREG